MPVARGEVFAAIKKKLTQLERWVELDRNAGRQDVFVSVENTLCGLLNLSYQWDLQNANKEEACAKTLDLHDIEGRVAVQVTVSTTLQKVKSTVEAFKESLSDDYDVLYVVHPITIIPKSTFKAKVTNDFTFDVKKHRLGLGDILGTISFLSVEEQKNILAFLEREVPDLKPPPLRIFGVIAAILVVVSLFLPLPRRVELIDAVSGQIVHRDVEFFYKLNGSKQKHNAEVGDGRAWISQSLIRDCFGKLPKFVNFHSDGDNTPEAMLGYAFKEFRYRRFGKSQLALDRRDFDKAIRPENPGQGLKLDVDKWRNRIAHEVPSPRDNVELLIENSSQVQHIDFALYQYVPAGEKSRMANGEESNFRWHHVRFPTDGDSPSEYLLKGPNFESGYCIFFASTNGKQLAQLGYGNIYNRKDPRLVISGGGGTLKVVLHNSPLNSNTQEEDLQ